MPDDDTTARPGEDVPQIGRARAYIERDSLTPGSQLRFIAANEGVMADGIDLRMTGARLDRFRSNPVIGFGHSYWGRANLPIGRATHSEVSGSRLLMDVEMDPGDPFAMEVDRKIRAGYLSAMSIGFEVTRWQDGKGSYWQGGVAEEWELTESSIVPIPMDAAALCVGGRAAPGDSIDRAWLRAMVDEFGLDRVMGVFGPLPARESITVLPPKPRRDVGDIDEEDKGAAVSPEVQTAVRAELTHLGLDAQAVSGELVTGAPLVARVDEEALARAIKAAFGDITIRLPDDPAPADDSAPADPIPPTEGSAASRAAVIDDNAARDVLAAFTPLEGTR